MTNTILSKTKKGGPYTKKEQEERKLQVCHLHFEKEKSAVEIAKMLGVNRNTINEDIKNLNNQIGDNMDPKDHSAKINNLIQRLEIQRDRMFEYLENATEPAEIKMWERSIFMITEKLANLSLKMATNKIELPYTKIKDVDEDEIKDITRELLMTNHRINSSFECPEVTLKIFIIMEKKCDLAYADNIFNKMKSLGLELFKRKEYFSENPDYDSKDGYYMYHILMFAAIRGYITNDEHVDIIKEDSELKKDSKRKEDFIDKYGPMSNWPKKIHELFNSSKSVYDLDSDDDLESDNLKSNNDLKSNDNSQPIDDSPPTGNSQSTDNLEHDVDQTQSPSIPKEIPETEWSKKFRVFSKS